MEQLNFVKNGVVRLPPGFRFHPTDEELVVQYLKRKVFSCPLPAFVIPEMEVYKFDPWDLPGNADRERYFFTPREWKHSIRSRSNRASGSGYWRSTGLDKEVFASKSNQIVGMKKVLVFYRGKHLKSSRTDWVMHEYRLSDAAMNACLAIQKKYAAQGFILPNMDWVLCRIFQRKRGNAASNRPLIREICGDARDVVDVMDRNMSEMDDACSCSNSSVITEISSDESRDEVSSSCRHQQP